MCITCAKAPHITHSIDIRLFLCYFASNMPFVYYSVFKWWLSERRMKWKISRRGSSTPPSSWRPSASRATVYRIIRELNGELHEKGVRTIDGRVDRDYLLSKYFAPTDGSEA